MTRAVITALCSVLLVAACGGEGQETAATTDTADVAPAKTAPKTGTQSSTTPVKAEHGRRAAKGPTVKVVSSQYGPVVADGRGEAFYLFASEKSSASKCYGACMQRWPPVLAKGTPRATTGAQSRLLGTTRRTDGKLQLTYAGHPMYYYAGDAPGRILCQGVNEFGGLWLVVRSSGKPVI